MQNEDGNPQLVILDPANAGWSDRLPAPSVNGGGYDDIVFRNGNVYFSASNPGQQSQHRPGHRAGDA